MVQWASIIVAPLVFLTNLSLVYALVPVACQSQQTWPLHLSNGISLVFAITASLIAWRAMRRTAARRRLPDDDLAHAPFLSHIGAWVSALSALAIALQWSTQLLLSPCYG
jgi:predicted lysophospholipase L1 biosynthesis ABC-type transport system permease subunit